MTIWWLITILVTLFGFAAGFLWLIVKLNALSNPKSSHNLKDAVIDAANQDVEHIFNNEFREELRNRGRLYFEKIIGDNAMFLQQDLRLTTSQLNEYMKQEITSKLKDEFAKYEQSITDAKQIAIDSIEKTKTTIDEQRQELIKQLNIEVEAEKKRLINRFEENLADIVNYYVLSAIGKQIDLSDQLEYIISELEANKAAIADDIKYGT